MIVFLGRCCLASNVQGRPESVSSTLKSIWNKFVVGFGCGVHSKLPIGWQTLCYPANQNNLLFTNWENAKHPKSAWPNVNFMETGPLGKYYETVKQYHDAATFSLKNSSCDQTILVLPYKPTAGLDRRAEHYKFSEETEKLEATELFLPR